MTFEKILNDLSADKLSAKDAFNEMNAKDKRKRINYYTHINNISNEPLKDGQLQELNAIVNILQILYNSSEGSTVSDPEYDLLQEMLIDMGIPRLNGSVELTDQNKVNGKHTQLRGTLDKVYYLYPTEKRTNKSRKYLDEWIKAKEALYEKITGKSIDLNNVKCLLQPKFDGSSTTLEIDDKMLWITRGDTQNNLASDVSNVLKVFNDDYKKEDKGTGIKFEAMCSENNKERINELYRHAPYHNSRQIATSVLNSNEPDFKVEMIDLIPLRIIHDGETVERIHPNLIKNFPTEICTLGDRDIIKKFADDNRYVYYKGMKFRTDGAVLTIIDPEIQRVLGRDRNINNFEVAYKFTEEYAYTKVKSVEFDTSDFGYICPVLIVNTVLMKGNNVSRISLSNKERFDELNLSYGDEVKVLYDIIPYVTLDEKCQRVPNGRKIEFVDKCPKCNNPLDLDVTQVQCKNPNCPSRFVGKVLNYCQNLKIHYIGYSTLDLLYTIGLLDDGIRSLYKLKSKSHMIMDLEGFGKNRTKKIIKEIESKRKLKDADFFGSIGIEGLSIKTFELIFDHIKLSDFMNMIKLKNWDLMRAQLINIKGIGGITADKLIEYFKDSTSMSMFNKLLKEVKLHESYSKVEYIGRVTFTGCRPSDDIKTILKKYKYKATDGWADTTKCLVIPKDDYESSKVVRARELNIPIITMKELSEKLKGL